MLKKWFSAGENLFAPPFSLRYSFCMKKESLIFFRFKNYVRQNDVLGYSLREQKRSFTGVFLKLNSSFYSRVVKCEQENRKRFIRQEETTLQFSFFQEMRLNF